MKFVVTVKKTFEVTQEGKIIIDVPDDEEFPETIAEDLAMEICDSTKLGNLKVLEEFEDEDGKVSVAKPDNISYSKLEWKTTDDGEKDARYEVGTVRKFKSSKEPKK